MTFGHLNPVSNHHPLDDIVCLEIENQPKDQVQALRNLTFLHHAKASTQNLTFGSGGASLLISNPVNDVSVGQDLTQSASHHNTRCQIFKSIFHWQDKPFRVCQGVTQAGVARRGRRDRTSKTIGMQPRQKRRQPSSFDIGAVRTTTCHSVVPEVLRPVLNLDKVVSSIFSRKSLRRVLKLFQRMQLHNARPFF